MTRFQFLQGLNRRFLPFRDVPASGKAAIKECATEHIRVYWGNRIYSRLSRIYGVHVNHPTYIAEIYGVPRARRPKGIPGRIFEQYRRK